MLETAEERVRLLKAGIDGKTIEKLYINLNNFKIVHIPILFESPTAVTESIQAHIYEPFYFKLALFPLLLSWGRPRSGVLSRIPQ